jgi:hypothetical protein
VILIEFRPKISMRRSHAMAAGPSIDVSGWLEAQLAQASPDLLRAMITTFTETLMGAGADAVCGAGYGERSDERRNTRNGYRRRDWDTRAGSISLAIPNCGRTRISRIGCWTPPPCRDGPGDGGGHVLSAGRLDPADGEAGRDAGHHPPVEVFASARWPTDVVGIFPPAATP